MPPLFLLEAKAPEEMPWSVREILIAAEEFRTTIARTMGQDWAGASPRVPLTREEVKGLIRRQMEPSEQSTFRQPAKLGFVSAKPRQSRDYEGGAW